MSNLMQNQDEGNLEAAFAATAKPGDVWYGHRIDGPDGYCHVNRCSSPEKAVAKVVSMAIESGWHPPRWWEFWLPKWSKDARCAYEMRMILDAKP